MTTPQAPSPATRAAVRHARARWAGALFFVLAVVALSASMMGLPLGYGNVGDVLVSLAACGLSLGCFGSHSDTAVSILRDRRWHEPAPEGLAAEIDAEVLFRRLDLSELKGMPRTAWALTILAPAALAWAAWRLLG